jgi:holo-ACP synthase/triphosphoribosyl-dephospho-CoA synthase
MEILNARDERVKKQRELIEKYKKPLISYTLNIAGSIKRSPLFDVIFDEGLHLIQSEIENSLLFKEIKRESTGNIAYLVVDDKIVTLKKKMVEIEKHSHVARLYDIDVIKLDFKPFSRKEIGIDERCCIICKRPYMECRINKSHSIDEVMSTTQNIVKEEFAKVISNIASYCLIAELSTTPKPGLVDRMNNGSHCDMNYELFLKSINSITPYLKEEYLASLKIKDKNELFMQMKNIGLMAENAMMIATNGINTHKGAFFSLSNIGCGICYLLANDEELTDKNIRLFVTEFSLWAQDHNVNHNSNGYKVREVNRTFGIYYEAIKGYSSIFDCCDKYLNAFKDEKYKYVSHLYNYEKFDYFSFNKIIEEQSLRIFCTLLSCVDDSNIIHRGGLDALCDMHKQFKELDDENIGISDLKSTLYKFDLLFIEANLSPGGTADLLSIALFIMLLKALNIIR